MPKRQKLANIKNNAKNINFSTSFEKQYLNPRYEI